MKISELFKILTYKELRDDGFELLETDDDSGKIDSKNNEGKNDSWDTSGEQSQDAGEETSGGKAGQDGQQQNNKYVSDVIGDNVNHIKTVFKTSKNKDVVIREFKIGWKVGACLVFLDGMADKTAINQFILRELMDRKKFNDISDIDTEFLISKVLTINQIKTETKYNNIINQVLDGMSALFIDGSAECIIMETRGFEKRSVDKPVSENVIRGSQEGFTESMRTNLTLIHKLVKNENLNVEFIPIDVKNKIKCAIVYMRNIANPTIVGEVKRRLKKFKTDSILGDGMIEQMIEDSPFALIPQVLETERPDRAASFIMEGKVVIICEGTPFVIAVPVTFLNLIHTSEDSLLRWQYGSFLRMIRVTGMLFAVLLPALYIALTLYHQEMIPTLLLDSIAKSRENVPFPTVVEVVIMEFSFELIREGGIRIPTISGQTLGIIGALILGQAAVSAGLVSPILIIIVAITGLGSFTIPNYGLSVGFRITRFIFILFGSIAGFYGVALCLFIVGGFMVSMKSFGVPFFAPIAPTTRYSADRIMKMPAYRQELRPDHVQSTNRRRQPHISRRWKLRGSDDEE